MLERERIDLAAQLPTLRSQRDALQKEHDTTAEQAAKAQASLQTHAARRDAAEQDVVRLRKLAAGLAASTPPDTTQAESRKRPDANALERPDHLGGGDHCACRGLSVVTIAVVWDHARRRARLPDATRYENLREEVAGLEVRLRELQEQLREIDQKIHDRDRLAAEVAALTGRRDNLRAEFAALAGAEQQIDAMKQRAAEAAGEFATETGKLDEVKLALQEATARLTEAQEHLDRLQKDAGALEARNRLSQETLPAEIEKLQATLGGLSKQNDALDLELSDLKSVRASLFAARAETAALAARNDALEARHQELQRHATWHHRMDQLAQLRDERDALRREITQVQMTRDALLGARDELAAVTARSEAVNREVELARRTRDDLLDGRELANARRELAQVGDEVAALRAERATLGQMATRAALDAEIARLRLEASGTGTGESDSTMIAADLAQLPS